jgi:hypothetical protein
MLCLGRHLRSIREPAVASSAQQQQVRTGSCVTPSVCTCVGMHAAVIVNVYTVALPNIKPSLLAPNVSQLDVKILLFVCCRV